MVIDLWVNSLSKEAAAAFLGKSGFGSVEGFFGVDVRDGMTPVDLVAEMDRVGVDRAVLSTPLSRVDDDTLAFAATHRDRLYLATSVDRPDRPKQQSMAVRRRAAEGTVDLVRVSPLVDQYPLNHALYYPVYATCEELALPVSINIGIPGPRVRSRCQDPVLLEDVLIDFPELVVIGAHMGHPFEELLIEFMLKWPNLYLSNSAFLAKYMHPSLIKFMGSRRGRGRVLFASDHPFLPMEKALAAARSLALDEGPMADFLGGTAERLLESGPVVDLLPDQLRLMASTYPDEVAYRNLGDESSITFSRWETESNRLAHGLQAKGVRKGDLVAIDLEAEQILDFIVTYSAVHKIGAVCVPMNNRLSPPEIRSILEHAEVTAVVCSVAFEDAFEEDLAPLPSLTVVATVGPSEHGRFPDLEDVKSEDASAIQVPIDEADLADVMYTSGTTGMPKGVAVRHGNVALLPNALPRWNGLKWLSATPVFTFAGLGFIYNPMKAGMTVLYLPKFDAGQWLDIVARERPVIAFVVPAMARLLIHHPEFDSADLSSLKRLVLGSAPLSPDTVERLQDRLPKAAVLNSYGMTEGGHATFTMDAEGARKRPGAVGRPTPPVEVRIVDNDGKVLSPGEIGEVITRNPSGHREYYRNPEATARMWGGGWLHTGDLGHLDADGYLYIVGRKKEMVVRGGLNVYADDVEAVLQAHPAVVEAAVIGIPHEVLGEDIAAYVVLRPGATVSTDELQAFARERLADYKVPRQVHYLAALPRNPGGKVLKSRLGG